MDTQPKTRKGFATKSKMIKTAADLIRQQGISATTVNDILSASKTGKSQFSHYFGSKEALISAVIEFHGQNTITAHREILINVQRIEDIKKWFKAFIENQQECLKTHRVGCPLGQMALEIPYTSNGLNVQIQKILFEVRTMFIQALHRLQQSGSLCQQAPLEGLANLFLVILEGGYLLSKVERTSDPLINSFDHAFCYLKSFELQQ